MNLEDRKRLTEEFKAFCVEEDMDIVGIAALDEMNAGAKVGRRPCDIAPGAKAAVVFAGGMLDPLYHAWMSPQEDLTQATSITLNVMRIRQLKMQRFLRSRGYDLARSSQGRGGAFNIGFREAEAFRLAGLGYVGKHQMAISAKYGPRINLGSFLTEAPLIPDEPYTEDHCGSCTVCEQFCISGAIMGDNYYNARQCESVVNCRPNCIYFSLMGWHDCDMCQRKCPQGEYRYSAEDRRGDWWKIVRDNRKSLIAQHTIYRDYLDSEQDGRLTDAY